jgi:hypothetical protein
MPVCSRTDPNDPNNVPVAPPSFVAYRRRLSPRRQSSGVLDIVGPVDGGRRLADEVRTSPTSPPSKVCGRSIIVIPACSSHYGRRASTAFWSSAEVASVTRGRSQPTWCWPIWSTWIRPAPLTPLGCALKIPPSSGGALGTLFANWTSRAWRRLSMGQRVRIFRSRKPTLTHVARALVRLLDAIGELEELREKIRLAEAARVLH